MPPRQEAELDPVTLHNLALLSVDHNPTESFNKLQFLLQQQVSTSSFPLALTMEPRNQLVCAHPRFEFPIRCNPK